MVEQSVTQLPKWPKDLQQSTLTLTGLDGWSERADPINRLVMSGRLSESCKRLLLVSKAESGGCRVNHTEERPMFLFYLLLSNKLGDENLEIPNSWSLSSVWVYWICRPDLPKQMGFPLDISLHRAPWWIGSTVSELSKNPSRYKIKLKPKRKNPKIVSACRVWLKQWLWPDSFPQIYNAGVNGGFPNH